MSAPNDATLAACFGRAMNGDAGAWRELVVAVTPGVFAALTGRAWGVSATDVEDAIADAWVDIVGRKIAFDSLRSFQAYFYGVARNKLLMIIRRAASRRWKPLDGVEAKAPPAGSALANADLLARVEKCWQRLSTVERQRLNDRFPNACELFLAAIGQTSSEAIDLLRDAARASDGRTPTVTTSAERGQYGRSAHKLLTCVGVDVPGGGRHRPPGAATAQEGIGMEDRLTEAQWDELFSADRLSPELRAVLERSPECRRQAADALGVVGLAVLMDGQANAPELSDSTDNAPPPGIIDRVMRRTEAAYRRRTNTGEGESLIQTLAVMITDMAGSTEFAERHGALAARNKQLTHDRLLTPLIDGHRGTVISKTGDAIVAFFDDVADAAGCAVEMMRRLQTHNASDDVDLDDLGIHIRAGIHWGKTLVYRDGDRLNLTGSAVNIAARVESGADKRTDQIIVSEAAYAKLLGSSAGFDFSPIGTVNAKGFGPLRLFRLDWQETTAEAPTMRLAAKSAEAAGDLPLDTDDTRGVHALFVDPADGRGYVRPVYVRVVERATGAIRCRSNGGRVLLAAAERAVRAAFATLLELGFSTADAAAYDIEWWIDGTPAHYDGASAGLAIALATVAAFAGTPIDPTTAVTGAMDSGAVLKVASVATKWNAVRASGFKTVVLPADTRADLPADAFAPGNPRPVFVSALTDAVIDLLGPAIGIASRRLDAATEAVVAGDPGIDLNVWIESGRDVEAATRDISVIPVEATQSHRVGDAIRICCRVNRDCYLALVNIGPTGNPTILIPNGMRTDAAVRAGETWTFPSPSDPFNFQLSGPAGTERVIVLACSSPPHLTPDVFRQAGLPFAVPATRDIAIVKKVVDQIILARRTVEFYVSEDAADADTTAPAAMQFRSIDF